MKNIWLKAALTAVAGFSITSCADFLELTPEDLIVEDNYWDEQHDVDQVMTGCYTRMQDYDFLARAFVWGEARADNVAAGNIRPGNSEYEILQENIISTNAYTSWTPFYSVINRCNLVIDRAPKVAAIDPDYSDSEVRATIAEAKGVRALCYFYLVRTFKDVPYYTYAITSDDQDLALPVTDGNQILDELIADLQSIQGDASLKFLNGKNDITYARMNRVAIWALLSDMCLWRGNYAMAIEYADKVITYKNRFNPQSDNYDPNLSTSTGMGRYLSERYYAGADKDEQGNEIEKQISYPLLDDKSRSQSSSQQNGVFGSAFSEIFGTGGSDESIFELSFDGINNSDNTKNNDMIDDFFRRYRDRNGRAANGKFSASTPFVELFGSNNNSGDIFLGWKNEPTSENALSTPDARFLEAIYFGEVTKETVSSGELVKLNWTSYSVYPNGGSTSLYYRTSSPRNTEKNNANWIFYRVSDVMLIKAEALVNAYPGDESQKRMAFDIVRAINDRSNTERVLATNNYAKLDFSQYSNSDALNKLILEERRREFLFEGKRWFDLVRWSRRVGNTEVLRRACTSKMPNGPTSGSGKLTNMNAIYYPYNKVELETNPNLHQNPAYPEVDNDGYESTK